MANFAGRGTVDGLTVNRSDEPLGFYGTTPITKPTVATTALVTTPASTTMATRINAIQTALRNLGII